MKIWFVKNTTLVESILINFFNLQFINSTYSYYLRHWASYMPICCISYLRKIPKSWFNSHYLKKKKSRKKKRFKLNEKLKVDIWSFVTSSGLLLDVWGLLFTEQIIKILNVCVDQKTRPNICFKKRGGTFETLSQAFQTLGQAFEKLSWAFESLRDN